MSTRERLYSLIDEMDEEQMTELIVLIQNRSPIPEQKPTPESLCGILHEYAKPGLQNLEKGAWERDIIERIINGDESF